MKWKFWQNLDPEERAELRAKGVDGPDESVIADVKAQVDAQVQATLATERAAMQKALRDAHAARLQTEAAAYADGLVKESKALTAEREAIIGAYVQAALDDATHEAAPAADGKATSRLDRVKGLYAARPAHGLFREYIDPGTGRAVKVDVLRNPTDGSVQDISTPEGAAAAATKWAEKQNGNGAAKH